MIPGACPGCQAHAAFAPDGLCAGKTPKGAARWRHVSNLPTPVGDLYDEVGGCMQCGAHTSAAMAMRKLLMHVAVDKGAMAKV